MTGGRIWFALVNRGGRIIEVRSFPLRRRVLNPATLKREWLTADRQAGYHWSCTGDLAAGRKIVRLKLLYDGKPFSSPEGLPA